MNTQNSNNIFVFDMDNTLVKTDRANNLAYSEAISSVLGAKYAIDDGKRFTRNKLREIFPQLTQKQIDEIIVRKEKSFESLLKETELNKNLFNILKHLYHEGCHTILLTNCQAGRAISLCKYYNITKFFVQRFFHEDYVDNKYIFLRSLGYDLQNVVLYENEDYPSLEAISNGIKSDQIIKISF